VRRATKFATAAEEWFKKVAPADTVTTAALWEGLCETRPDLTTPTERRKTPKATCMRDLRQAPGFTVADGRVTYKGRPAE
jgi:hypothetical protein